MHTTQPQSISTPSEESSPCFHLKAISKHFGGVHALAKASLKIMSGQIHGLVGENGAGKSTLINISTGVIQPDHGEIWVGERRMTMNNPLVAAAHGVIAVHQEADLFAELTLAENMLLGEGLSRNRLGFINWKATYRRAAEALERMGEKGNVRAAAGTLSIGRRVLAEIAAALAGSPRILFLDEPTASLTTAESSRLFVKLAELKRSGVAIIYVSHRLQEVLEICDKVTVLRDGTRVTTEPAATLSMDRLVSMMVGRETRTFFSRNRGQPGEDLFRVKNLSCPNGGFQNLSFSIGRGEIVGWYGLIGSGRSEMARALFGLAPSMGDIFLMGNRLNIKNPRDAIRSRMAYLPEDRLLEGIFPAHSCQSNVTAAILRRLSRWGWIRRSHERSVMNQVIDRFGVKLDTPEQPIRTLSGGNQQKLVLGRWLATEPDLLILDEPTRGVDVGAKVEIHRLMDELAANGKAIILISSELSEVIHMSDRVLVMREGRLAGTFNPRTDHQDAIAATAFPTSHGHSQGTHFPSDGGIIKGLIQMREIGILTVLSIIVGLMALYRPAEFATFKNMIDILTAGAIVSVAAAGMTLVIASGGIDISIGSLLGLIGAIAGLSAMNGVPPTLCLTFAIGLGAIWGALNSIISTLGRIHPIIVTLAGISIYRGLLLQVTNGYEVNLLPAGYRALTDGRLAGLPKVLWIALGILALNWILISRTLLGRRMLAVGNSEKAARLIGLSPWRLRLAAFAILGACIGLAAVMWGGYYGKIQSNTGLGWELQVIAATVIGGCSIMGGRGTALGAFLGSVLIALVYNILIILKISAYWQGLFVGALILGAVLVDIWLPQWISQGRRWSKGS